MHSLTVIILTTSIKSNRSITSKNVEVFILLSKFVFCVFKTWYAYYKEGFFFGFSKGSYKTNASAYLMQDKTFHKYNGRDKT